MTATNPVAQIILSESVQNIPAGMRQNVNVVNPFLGLFLPYIPSAASFAITVLLYFEKPVSKLQIEVRIERAVDSKELFTTGVSTMEGNIGLEAGKSNLNLNVELRNIGIETAGEYSVICKLDNNVVASQSFFVEKIEV